MANARRTRVLERQARIRELRSEGKSRSEISDILGVSIRTVDSVLEFFDEDETECGWDPNPHHSPDHRQCRLRREGSPK